MLQYSPPCGLGKGVYCLNVLSTIVHQVLVMKCQLLILPLVWVIQVQSIQSLTAWAVYCEVKLYTHRRQLLLQLLGVIHTVLSPSVRGTELCSFATFVFFFPFLFVALNRAQNTGHGRLALEFVWG